MNSLADGVMDFWFSDWILSDSVSLDAQLNGLASVI